MQRKSKQKILHNENNREYPNKDIALFKRLLDFGKRLLAESDVKQVLQVSIDLIIKLTNAERGMIILFDQDENNIFETARNLKKEDIESPRFEISNTIINNVKQTSNPICIPNALEDSIFNNSVSVEKLKILSVICLPLNQKNKLFGVIYIDNRTLAGAFRQKTIDLANEFGDFISLAAFRALELHQMQNRQSELEKELKKKYDFEAIIGHHPAMVKILKLVSQIANTDTPVLVQGESGTGKELIAQALHYNSNRRDGPFIPINCGALPENLLESELFGHVKGAFTGAINDKMGWFERAHNGTIFLDEVSEMTPALQVKLLRVLQSGEFSCVGSSQINKCDVRIISATNQNLHKLVMEKKFREDLFYRLNVINIEIPPLRVRKTDIPLLKKHFLRIYDQGSVQEKKQFSKEAEIMLMAYNYPGNVRELENTIQRAVTLSENKIIEPQHLPDIISHNIQPTHSTETTHTLTEVKQSAAKRAEEDFIIICLEATKGHISKAAEKAGINVSNFYKSMKKYKIDPNDFKK